ncbi:MAG: hypothetical protein WBS19_08720 [Candidatus Korobacteraceae bacterium]
MYSGAINQNNVGTIAERIVANELEFRGFRVTDLNRDRTSANADLLAVRGDKILQVQVKGATQVYKHACVLYGVCTEDMIQNDKHPMFNRHAGFYRADVVVLVAVTSPTEYSCVVFPVREAEKAAQLNLKREFRTLTLKGEPHKPHKVWAFLDHKPRTKDPARQPLLDKEAELLSRYKNRWDILESVPSATISKVK